jgi:hypothetical protein
MARLNGASRRALVALGAITLVAAPALTQGRGPLPALAKLEPGLWKLRDLGGGRAQIAPICVSDPNVLIQVRHRNSHCGQLVVSSDARSATVQYTCQSGGFGRTTLLAETPRLAQIDTQGIADNIPFAYRLEARRIGSCTGGGQSPGGRGR